MLERHFGELEGARARSGRRRRCRRRRTPAAPRVFLVDKPGAVQSNILVGQVLASSSAPQPPRDGHHEQRARRHVHLAPQHEPARGQALVVRRPLEPAGRARRSGRGCSPRPVQTDKTVESLREMQREIAEFVGTRPATAEEIAKIRNRDVRALSGRYETNASVSGAIAEMITFGWPDDYVRTLKSRLEAQTDEAVRAAARESLDPGRMTWVVIGDLKTIEQPIRELGLGEVQVLDADGQVIR